MRSRTRLHCCKMFAFMMSVSVAAAFMTTTRTHKTPTPRFSANWHTPEATWVMACKFHCTAPRLMWTHQLDSHGLVTLMSTAPNLIYFSPVLEGNYTDLLSPSVVSNWSVIDVDWSNNKLIWANQHPMDAEQMLVEQAAIIKHSACPEECPLPGGCTKSNACPQKKVWVCKSAHKTCDLP